MASRAACWYPQKLLVYLLAPADSNRDDTNMSLTDLSIRSAKLGERILKMSDGGGLQLWVTPDGAKRWRLAYRFEGKQKTLAIGVYPSVGLRDAREARDEAKRLLASGQDPSVAKKLALAAKAASTENSFAKVADELLEKKRREGKTPNTRSH